MSSSVALLSILHWTINFNRHLSALAHWEPRERASPCTEIPSLGVRIQRLQRVKGSWPVNNNRFHTLATGNMVLLWIYISLRNIHHSYAVMANPSETLHCNLRCNLTCISIKMRLQVSSMQLTTIAMGCSVLLIPYMHFRQLFRCTCWIFSERIRIMISI